MIYALSDIHGNTPAFDRILSMIPMTADDQLYIIGDVVDRGPDGIALLQRIRQMPRTTLMLGNREISSMSFANTPVPACFSRIDLPMRRMETAMRTALTA